ncbi:unnamed protein product, partial [Rotaria magnacalcarata]
NFVPGETTVSSNVVAENTRSISETKQNGYLYNKDSSWSIINLI